MPTVYCDHNVLISVLEKEGFPPNGAFRGILDSGQASFVFSNSHLVEAARMRTIEEATNMARLLDMAGRFWLPDRLTLELDEMRHVLAGGPAPQPLLRTVTEIVARLRRDGGATEIVTALRLVQGGHARPRLMHPLLDAHAVNARAFRENVRAVKAGRLTASKDAEITRAVLRRQIRIHGIPAANAQLAEVQVERMPTFHTEVVLSRLRWGRGGRLRWQTFMDNEHMIVGLPHVDAYVTFDTRKRKFARTLSNQCSSCRAKVVGSLEEAAD